MNDRELSAILDFAVESAQLAGALTLGYFQTGTPHERKADRSPVTAADRAAEELLRRRIERAFPAHGIVGEEFGVERGDAAARWILDPIDGTQSFVCGVPLYSVLVGFELAGEMLAGVIHLPALHETIYAARGMGCRWNGRPARVSEVARLDQARVAYCSSKGFVTHRRAAAFERLRDACEIDRGWGDAYAYALVATGRADLALDPIMSVWDNAALAPVVREAGGTFTDWRGRATHTATESLATNGRLLDETLALLADGRAGNP